MKPLFLIPVLIAFSLSVQSQTISGTLQVWHKITLSFEGPTASESGDPNPFADYRLEVHFSNGENTYQVPGYFAADGKAAETSARSGNIWRVHFAPPDTGQWTYETYFYEGQDVAINQGTDNPGALHGITGAFEISASDKTGRDHRARGMLKYDSSGYLKHQGSGHYFIKIGADSPETLLAYADFDGTYVHQGNVGLKSWAPHLDDWVEGDPTWKDNKGKGLIGAINYLASKGQNAFSFLTMNINGDGKNVWPYVSHDTLDRFDCSKLDQWEIIFTHADKMGMFLHFKTQETENDNLLDGGKLARQRTLYYRELIARFAHHLALNWNLGEENKNFDTDRLAFSQYFYENDPYRHPVVVHTFPNWDEFIYPPMLGAANKLTGASLQVDWDGVHQRTLKWVNNSKEAGFRWIVANDEQGNAQIGVPNDGNVAGGVSQDGIRKYTLWGNLMAGGAGVEYYFGYALPQNDLHCEDFRSRDRMWDYNRYAQHFFTTYLPFWEMTSLDTLIGNTASSNARFCFGKTGEIYVIYLPEGGTATLDLQDHESQFRVRWYNPRTGEEPERGTVATVQGPGPVDIGKSFSENEKDWAVLIERIDDRCRNN